jgi:hypothetical protein
LVLIFPAIYCDVTRAWLLPRRQRLAVDIGGVCSARCARSGGGPAYRTPRKRGRRIPSG